MRASFAFSKSLTASNLVHAVPVVATTTTNIASGHCEFISNNPTASSIYLSVLDSFGNLIGYAFPQSGQGLYTLPINGLPDMLVNMEDFSQITFWYNGAEYVPDCSHIGDEYYCNLDFACR